MREYNDARCSENHLALASICDISMLFISKFTIWEHEIGILINGNLQRLWICVAYCPKQVLELD